MVTEIQKVSLLTSTTPTEPVKRSDEQPIIIGDEMTKKFTQVKAPEMDAITPKEFASIKLMVAMAYPEVDIDNLSNFELQNKYYPQYKNGTLQKKIEAMRPKRKEVLDTIKNEKRDPSEVANELLDKRLALHHEGYQQLPEKEKMKLRNEAKLKFLKTIMPEKFANTTPRDEKKAVREFTTTTEALIYAFQSGKISSKEDVEAIFNDPHRIGELQYEWAEAYFKEHPDELEKLDTSALNASEKTSKRRLYMALQRGKLDNAILAESGMKTLEELHHSGKYTELKLAYLKAHENELSKFEQKELKTLEEQLSKNHGDLSGIRNIAAESNIDTSLTEQILETDGVDIENGEIEINTKEDFEKIKSYTQQIKAQLNECKTEDELKSCIQEIRKSAQTEAEAQILDKMINHIMAEFSDEENNLLTPEFYINALAEIGISPHMAVQTSVMSNAKTQMAYSDITDSTDAMTNTQKAGFTEEVIPDFETSDAKLYSVKKMTDTGIKEVHDVLAATYAKFDDATAQQAFEYAMTSDNVSAEQKAIIARDTIDNTQNADLKKFYQDLANKYNVDYVSVPPKAERVNTSSDKTTANDNKIVGTTYTQQQFDNSIAKSIKDDENIVTQVINGLIDVTNTILGKTSEPKVAETERITSINFALEQIESGTPFAKVFNKCSESVKKDFIKGILASPQRDTAIKYLLENGVGFDQLLGLAQTGNAEQKIYAIATNVHISTVKDDIKNSQYLKA